MLGWNYRISEFQAAVLLAQLERLPGQLEKKVENFKYLTEQLTGINGITPITSFRDRRVTRQSFYRYVIEYDSAHFAGKSVELFRKALAAEGIPCGCTYTPVYKSNLFVVDDKYCKNASHLMKRYGRIECPITEKASKMAVAFNHEMFLGPRDDMDDILEAVTKIMKHADELKD
jgi:dTDP-4-amino-4,6-dideoxygalactose transaminase